MSKNKIYFKIGNSDFSARLSQEEYQKVVNAREDKQEVYTLKVHNGTYPEMHIAIRLKDLSL